VKRAQVVGFCRFSFIYCSKGTSFCPNITGCVVVAAAVAAEEESMLIALLVALLLAEIEVEFVAAFEFVADDDDEEPAPPNIPEKNDACERSSNSYTVDTKCRMHEIDQQSI
jgi:hypothetical protein